MLRLSVGPRRRMRDYLIPIIMLLVCLIPLRWFLNDNANVAVRLYCLFLMLVIAAVACFYYAKQAASEISDEYARLYDRILMLVNMIGQYNSWTDLVSTPRKDYVLCRENDRQLIIVTEYLDEYNSDTMRVEHHRLTKEFDLSWHRDRVVKVTYMMWAVAIHEGDLRIDSNKRQVREVARKLPSGLFRLTAMDLKMLHDQMVSSIS